MRGVGTCAEWGMAWNPWIFICLSLRLNYSLKNKLTHFFQHSIKNKQVLLENMFIR